MIFKYFRDVKADVRTDIAIKMLQNTPCKPTGKEHLRLYVLKGRVPTPLPIITYGKLENNVICGMINYQETPSTARN